MDIQFQCKSFFTSAKGKVFSIGDVINKSDYNILYANEKNNFNDITPVNYYSGKSSLEKNNLELNSLEFLIGQ